MKIFKGIPLYAWILISILLGLGWGFFSISFGINNFTSDWISPWGKIFLNLLKLIAIPLIFVSLVKAISDLGDSRRLSGMGLRTFFLYMLTTIIAITIGLLVVNVIRPGDIFPRESMGDLMTQFGDQIKEKVESAVNVESQGPLQFLVNIVPDNFVAASASNRNMLQVIFFAILLGVSLLAVRTKRNVDIVVRFFDGMNDVIMKMIDLIMKFAPIGVFALMASVLVDVVGNDPSKSVNLLASMALYAACVALGLMLMIVLIYPLMIRFLANTPVFKFIKGVFPAQLIAFSTSSSAATLPVTKKCCEENLNIDSEVTNFVLPIGATINMDGTSLYQGVAAVFIAQTMGIELDLAAQLTILLTATLASIGSAAVPGAGMVMLIVVLESVGLPPEGLALIIAMDRPLDMLRTAVNVTGDSAVSTIVSYMQKVKKK